MTAAIDHADAVFTLRFDGEDRTMRLDVFLTDYAEHIDADDVAAVKALRDGETYRGSGWRITRDLDGCDDCGGEGCRHCDDDYAATFRLRQPVV